MGGGEKEKLKRDRKTIRMRRKKKSSEGVEDRKKRKRVKENVKRFFFKR